MKSIESTLEADEFKAMGSIIADWTAVQACTRDLKPGETRKNLCGKVSKGLKKRLWLSLSPNVEEHLNKLVAS